MFRNMLIWNRTPQTLGGFAACRGARDPAGTWGLFSSSVERRDDWEYTLPSRWILSIREPSLWPFWGDRQYEQLLHVESDL